MLRKRILQTKDGITDQSQVEIEILGMSSGESDINIVLDQLIKNGFDVKLNMQPDYGSFKAQQDAGNYDVAIVWLDYSNR